MRLSRGLVQILSVAAVVAIMSPAEAQTSSPGRIVAFGDSLTDNGNLFATSGNPPAPYFQGRSSNGPTWVEILAGTPMNSPIQGTGVSGNVNLAFAGALAGPGVNLNGPIPSVTQQIAIYQGAGGTFANTGVVALWGGANNVLQYFASNGFGAGITQAGIVGNSVAAATTMAGNVTTVVKSGAKTVLVANLPDLAAAPAFNTNPAAQPGVTLGANAFNSALFTGLGLVAAGAPGVNVVYMATS